MTSITAVPTGGMAVTIVPSGGLPVTLVSATGVATGFARAQTVTANVPLTTGLLTTVSTFGLLAPLTYAKTGGNANLTLNTSTGGISATAALTAGASQTLNGTATGSDGVVIPFTATLTGATPVPVFTVQPSISPSSGLVGATFTATDGTASNTSTYTRRWLLDGTSIGTSTTVVPVVAGSLVLEVTATGAGGTTVATSTAVTVSAAGGGGSPVGTFTLNPATDPTAYPPALTVELPPELDYATSPTIRVRRATAENMTTGLVTPSAVAIPSSGPVNLGLSSISSGTWYFQADILVGGVVTYTSNIALHGNATAPAITSGTTFTTVEGADYAITVTTDRTVSAEIIGGRNPNMFRIQSGYGSSLTLTLLSQNVAVDTAVDVLVEFKGLNGKTVQQSITGTITAYDELPEGLTFTNVTGAPLSTAETATGTVSGLTSGHFVPFTAASNHTVNGASKSPGASTQVQNGDVIVLSATSSGIGASDVAVAWSAGDKSGTWVVTTLGTALASSNGVDKSWSVTVSGSPALTAVSADASENGGVRATAEPSGNLTQFEAAFTTKGVYGEMSIALVGTTDLTMASPGSLPNDVFNDIIAAGGVAFRHDPGTGNSFVLRHDGTYDTVTSTVGTPVIGGAHPDVIVFVLNKTANTATIYLNHWNGSAYVSTLLQAATGVTLSSWKPAFYYSGGPHGYKFNFAGPMTMPLTGGITTYA